MISSAYGMRPPLQIPLPLSSRELLARDDFIVCAGNESAVAYIDSWPDWPVPVVVLYGPSGCGKTHLATVWRAATNAGTVPAGRLAEERPPESRALVVEDVDGAPCSLARDAALLHVIDRAAATAPCLLTGRGHPASWSVALPDLASRFGALPALPLWAPDEASLAAIARKLFSDRQIYVPDALIAEMLRRLDRSPGAIRDFVDDLDAAALAAAKPVNLALLRTLIATRARE